MNPEIPGPPPEDQKSGLTPGELREARVRNLQKLLTVETYSPRDIIGLIGVLRRKLNEEHSPEDIQKAAVNKGQPPTLREIIAARSLSEDEIIDLIGVLEGKLREEFSPEDTQKLDLYKRQFPKGVPIIGRNGFFIPWEYIIQYEPAALKIRTQTLLRSANRGGLRPLDVYHTMHGEERYTEVLERFGGRTKEDAEASEERAFEYLREMGMVVSG